MGKLVEKLHQISAIQWIGRNNVLKIIQFIRIVFTQDLHGKANISRRFLLYVTFAVFVFFIKRPLTILNAKNFIKNNGFFSSSMNLL